MATLFELKDEILKGRRVKRSGNKYAFYSVDEIEGRNVFADDWELEPLPKKKKKLKLYAYLGDASLMTAAIDSNAGFSIFFAFVDNDPSATRLPNLDQEIEVDE